MFGLRKCTRTSSDASRRPGNSTTYQVPDAGPRFLTLGPDGNIWYTDELGFIGKFTPDATVTTYALPAGSDPRGIAVGPDGRLWFADFGTGKVGAITTAGVVSEYDAPSTPFGKPAGVDGQMWFMAQNQLLSATTDGHVRAIPLPDLPGGVLPAADGKVWTSFQDLNQIALVNRGGHIMQTYTIPTAGANPVGMTYGSDGNLWFSEPLAPQPQIGVLRL